MEDIPIICGSYAGDLRQSAGLYIPHTPYANSRISRNSRNPQTAHGQRSFRLREAAEASPLRALGFSRRRIGMHLELDDIIPQALHRQVGWDLRHHFMAEKIIDRFGLILPRDRELIRQLATIYVLAGLKRPPGNRAARLT